MSKVRGIRFTPKEDEMIEEFLEKNPLFDFSMMAKIAILAFIKQPDVRLNAVGSKHRKDNSNAKPIS